MVKAVFPVFEQQTEVQERHRFDERVMKAGKWSSTRSGVPVGEGYEPVRRMMDPSVRPSEWLPSANDFARGDKDKKDISTQFKA